VLFASELVPAAPRSEEFLLRSRSKLACAPLSRLGRHAAVPSLFSPDHFPLARGGVGRVAGKQRQTLGTLAFTTNTSPNASERRVEPVQSPRRGTVGGARLQDRSERHSRSVSRF